MELADDLEKDEIYRGGIFGTERRLRISDDAFEMLKDSVGRTEAVEDFFQDFIQLTIVCV